MPRPSMTMTTRHRAARSASPDSHRPHGLAVEESPQAGRLRPSPFKDRWFVLSRDRLLYFKSTTAQTAIAEIILSEATIRIIDKYTDAAVPPAFVSATAVSARLAAASGPHVPDTAFSWMFEIDNKQRTYLLRANNTAEYNEWLSRLLAACRPAHRREWGDRQTGRGDGANGERLGHKRRGADSTSQHTAQHTARPHRLRVLHRLGGRQRTEESVLCWLDCEGWRGRRATRDRERRAKRYGELL